MMFPVAVLTRSGVLDARSSCCLEHMWVIAEDAEARVVQCNDCGGTARVPRGELVPALFVAATLEVSA